MYESEQHDLVPLTPHDVAYGLTTTLACGYEETVTATRSALAAEGFGILTEIDVLVTLQEKLGAERCQHLAPTLILGACQPTLAAAALTAEPSVALLLPCNVVVRADGERTVVQALDPATMVELTGNQALHGVAADAAARLRRALAALTRPGEVTGQALAQ